VGGEGVEYKNGKKLQYSRVDKSFFQSNFFALLMKNFLKLKRNLVMLSFVFLLPAIQASRATSQYAFLKGLSHEMDLAFDDMYG
jgi:hypothetical protein